MKAGSTCILQVVYGCYAAVQLADVSALHLLAAKLPFFFRPRSWQKGAYQVGYNTARVPDLQFDSRRNNTNITSWGLY